LPHVKDGRLRIIAVTTPKRARMLPDVPTIAESGVPGYEFTGWMGVLAPQATPPDLTRKLQQEIVKIVFVPEMERRLAADAAEPVGSSPADFATFLKTDIATLDACGQRSQHSGGLIEIVTRANLIINIWDFGGHEI